MILNILLLFCLFFGFCICLNFDAFALSGNLFETFLISYGEQFYVFADTENNILPLNLQSLVLHTIYRRQSPGLFHYGPMQSPLSIALSKEQLKSELFIVHIYIVQI